MPSEIPNDMGETEMWLTSHGWFSGRDAGKKVDQLIAERIADFQAQGQMLPQLPNAARFLHEFGLLELPVSKNVRLILDPTGGYEEDAEDIADLAQNLEKQLFPVGYETYEGGILLIDEEDRFFYLHHTGAYFLGSGAQEMFANRRKGRTVDARDFYA